MPQLNPHNISESRSSIVLSYPATIGTDSSISDPLDGSDDSVYQPTVHPSNTTSKPLHIRIQLSDDGLMRQLALSNQFKTITISAEDSVESVQQRLIEKIIHGFRSSPEVVSKVKNSLSDWMLAVQYADNHGDSFVWLEDRQNPYQIVTTSNPQPTLIFRKPLSTSFTGLL